MGIRGFVKKTVKKTAGGVVGGVEKQVMKAAKGVGKQIPGYGEFNVSKSGAPKTNRAGNAVRKIGKPKGK